MTDQEKEELTYIELILSKLDHINEQVEFLSIQIAKIDHNTRSLIPVKKNPLALRPPFYLRLWNSIKGFVLKIQSI